MHCLRWIASSGASTEFNAFWDKAAMKTADAPLLYRLQQRAQAGHRIHGF